MNRFLQKLRSWTKYLSSLWSALIIAALIGLGVANGIQPYYEFKYSNLGKEDIQSLREAVRILKSDAFFSQNIDWAAEPELTWARANADGNISIALPELVRKLGDNHSRYLPVDEVRKWDTDPVLTSLSVKSFVRDGIGYVALPPFSGQTAEAIEHYSLKVRQAIAAARDNAYCGWVVDLRGNFGGNMAPMLDGISAFLGDEPYFYWKRQPGFWDIFNGPPTRVAWQGNVKAARRIPADLPLAILQDASTASAGELVLLSLKQRGLTKSFGVKSSGKPTGNQAIPLRNGGILAVTTSVPLTKDGMVWTGPISPDVLVAKAAGEEDSALDSAYNWILGSCPKSSGANRK